ncbi:hypothetical protein CcaverHIS631_0113360 [Cutaneotrichosporon cavernicola]|nr:hypothetical protein CcaverHIS631_0113360 [Cutaneotrichosporon cavernicola]BEJ04159.1 hypothetical protein CcaverHIS641_0113340 [Cutaneotrichosporon cavernicola]
MATETVKRQRTFEECDAILTAPGMPFEMVEMDIGGRRMRAWKNTPPSFRAYLIPKFKEFADREIVSSPIPMPAEFYARERLTYGQVYELALEYAAWMRGLGVVVGDRVAVGGRNSTGWLSTWLAVHLLGAVPVLLNDLLTDDAQTHCLGITTPKLVLVDEELAGKVGRLRAELSKRNVGAVYCWSSVDHLPPAARAGVKAIDTTSVRQADKDAIHAGMGGGLEGLNQFSDGCIFFTSGTTGYPKAVISTQRGGLHNVISAAVSPARMFLRAGLSVAELGAMMSAPAPQGVSLISIPLFHVTGNLASLLGTIGKGGKMVFQRKWNVKDAVKLVVDEKVTTMGGVPAIATAIIQSPDLPKDYQFTAVSYGGAPPPERLARDLKSRFPAAFVGQGWGMTETNAVVCHLSGPDYIAKPTSVGAAVPICDIKIVDPETRRELPRGSFGLLLSRGEGNMREYLNNPKATAETIDADGYVNTGDMGYIDEDGCLHLGDRMKDIIIRGGENIASAEVENALALDDNLAEVAAVSVPDDVLGERVGAIVSLAPGARTTEAEVLAAVTPRLRYPARPVIVVVHPEPLPRNANGKIIKTDCRKIVRDIFATRPKIEAPPRAKL